MKTVKIRWLLRGATLAIVVAALVAVGARRIARARENYERAQIHKQVLDAYYKTKRDNDELPALVLPENERGDDIAEDDPTIRRLYTLAYYGNQATPDVSEQRFVAATREAARWRTMLPARTTGGAQPNAVVAGQSWINLGPTNTRIEENGSSKYPGIDSGRIASIRVDPRNADVVYVATSWGGVWKTYNYSAAQPTWLPITDTIGALSVGALELDPSAPDTLYLGIGDSLDSSVAGGAMFKSTDGGGSWTMLTARLSGTYPAAAGGRTESAVGIRDIGVDGNDGNKLLVATDVGLFRSVDAGATFTLVPLPYSNGTTVEQQVWTVAYLGAAGGQSAWVVSGVDACATNQAPLGFGLDEPVGATTPTYSVNCPGGTLGDIWRSADSGATWTSLRFTSKLPSTGTGSSDYGRMAVAAGSTASGPDATTVYAQVANIDDSPAQSKQLGIFKSTDGGKTFTFPATDAGTVAVSNPDNNYCSTVNVAHDQAWYNLAIAVDPTNANHVLVGGNYCGVRTTDGGATWSNISHWLPPASTTTLPYVHADWHAIYLASVGGVFRAFAGSDGGLFTSTDVFTNGTPGNVTWNTNTNRGIVSHLFYSVASGDPTSGDDSVVFGGLQDNGTRFRDLDATAGSPTTFNQVIGGDGIGTALTRSGANHAYWASLPQPPARLLCTGDPATTCSQGTGWNNGPSLANGTTDPDPFFVRYSVIDGDANGSLLTATTFRLWKLSYNGGTKTGLTPAYTNANNPPPLGGAIRNIYASPFTHTDCGANGGSTCRLYGIALTGGKFAVVTDISGQTPTVAIATAMIGDSATNKNMKSTTSIAFPSSAAHFAAGKHDGQVYLAGSTAPRLDDPANIQGSVVVPDAVGRIFLTTDGGATYTPFHGNGTSDLPNVPVQVIVFDPSDTTDKTIFVGNDLGVYQTTDMGATWQRYGIGFPLVRVTEIRIAKNSGLMRVGTYGRGLWEIYPNANAAPGVRGDGDWDRNLAIDFLDLGAMAARLGDTPATATQPYYDWHLDVTGSVNSIAEDDLTALVGKFGSHP